MYIQKQGQQGQKKYNLVEFINNIPVFLKAESSFFGMVHKHSFSTWSCSFT